MRLLFCRHRRIPSFVAPVLVTAIISVFLFQYISMQLSPLIVTAAESKVKNLISQTTARAVEEALLSGEMGYEDFVAAETGEDGQITALSFRVAEGASFKRRVTERLVTELEEIPPDELSIPLGTLSGALLLSAIGPSIRVRIQSLGDVSSEYRNEFSSSGVNQTQHAIYLDLLVTVYLLIPGEIISVTTNEQVCVAETIIVGNVPDTYLNLQSGVR